MTEKIDIAEILKDKPANTKLYSPLFGEVYFSHVGGDNIAVEHHGGISLFFSSGRFFDLDESEPLLFPSKEMRNWRKFAWKKGDVLVSKDRNVHIIFDKFVDDAYKNFHGQYYLWKEEGSIVSFEEEEYYMQTSDFNKANKEDTQEYIHKIEKILGGNLNRETLEIEKAQPEFKDGDILSYPEDEMSFAVVLIFKEIKDRIMAYASVVISKYPSVETKNKSFNKNKLSALRLATDEEKKLLFDALAKEGKAWDAEHKMIVDLKPKVEFKPFDKVLCRNSKDDTWEADFFARLTRKEIDYTQSGKYLCVGDLWMYCIPYNEETAHLLGTTDEWKGGEG